MKNPVPQIKQKGDEQKRNSGSKSTMKLRKGSKKLQITQGGPRGERKYGLVKCSQARLGESLAKGRLIEAETGNQ